jgi:hydrogenase 3 maturation protease
MENWTKEITKKIKSWEKIAILGIGNTEKGDDGIGVFCVNQLKKLIKKENILLINGGNIPESYTGKIRTFSPNGTILIDACKKGEKPGSVFIVKENEISYNDISTHRVPLSLLLAYLKEEINTDVIFIGIEPDKIEGRILSKPVKKAGENIVKFLSGYLYSL